MGAVGGEFYRDVLAAIGAPASEGNLTLCRAWQTAEGGEATHNPFNCTVTMPGSTPYNTNNGFPVQSYRTHQTGVEATARTLKQANMAAVLAALTGDADPYFTAVAIASSPWGTPLTLLVTVLAENYKWGAPAS